MRRLRWVSACLLLGSLFLSARPEAQAPIPQAAFYGIGDLPGGQFSSSVRDATRVNGVIYAVGGGSKDSCFANSPCPSANTDTPILWTFNGTSATLEALPDLVPLGPLTVPVFTPALAITPDASSIVGRARSNATNAVFQGVRFTRATPASASQVLNVSMATGLGASSNVVAVNSNGTVVYGNSNIAGFPAFRFDLANSTRVQIDRLVTTDDRTSITIHGSSNLAGTNDGNIAVGYSFKTTNVLPFPAPHAFKFTFSPITGTGATTALPLLSGGTWNQPLALSANGNAVLLVGDSAEYPNGSVYVVGGTTLNQDMGSPNPAMAPSRIFDPYNGRPYAGGGNFQNIPTRVAVVSFSSNQQGDAEYAYFRNAHGWFHLESALAASEQKIDLRAMGWENLQIQGMSPDARLVYGVGSHNGNLEGFVADFGPGYLANFNPQAVAPTDTSIVGVWTDNPEEPEHIVVFMDDGTYFYLEDGTFERGLYTWNQVTGQLTLLTKNDNNGTAGLSDENGNLALRLRIVGDTIVDVESGEPVLARLNFPLNTFAGGFVFGDPTKENESGVLVVLPNGRFFMGEDSDPVVQPGGHDGGERGTLNWDPITGQVTDVVVEQDTNGDWGFSNNIGDPSTFVRLSADGLIAFAGDGTTMDSFAKRVVDPATVLPNITSAAAAAGTATVPFSYAITADRAVSYNAVNLPAGLNVNGDTGEISGAVAAPGLYNVTISATNSFGAVDTAPLALTFVPGNTPVDVDDPVTVTPEVPPGEDPVQITFSGVTEAGETTVTPLEPEDVPPPPANFAFGGALYDVETTADVVFPAVVCFSAGDGAGTPQLFHLESGVWVNITLDPDDPRNVPGLVCGETNSFSPFGVMVSSVERTGFYAPINADRRVLNTVKGGSTVPLKFEVFVGGVEKTTTDGLSFSVTANNCSSGTAEDPLDEVADGASTNLRYDAASGQFIQNWKVPKTPGVCYTVRITTVADGQSLQATLKVR